MKRVFGGLLALALIVGCGGGNTTTGNNNGGGNGGAPTGGGGPTGGGSTQTAKLTAAIWQPNGGSSMMTIKKAGSSSGLSLTHMLGLAMLSAQDTSASAPQVVMSFNGFCYTTETGDQLHILLYGLGDLKSQTCNTDVGTDPANVAGAGVPVIGDGELTTLRVYAKNVPVTSGSGVVTIYVNGNATNVTCTLAASANGASCADDADTFAVKDGDLVLGEVTLNGGDSFSQLRVVLGKQPAS